MCVYFWIRFIDIMLKAKRFLGYTNLNFPNEYEKNDTLILKHFQLLKVSFVDISKEVNKEKNLLHEAQ